MIGDEFNLADLFELTADAVPDRVPLVAGQRRLTYRELEARANRLAHALRERGVGPDDRIGVYAYNGAEWIEALLAAFKLRAVPVNVNHRYVDDELRYLFSDAELAALVFHRTFAPRVAAVRDELPTLHTLVAIDDGTDPTLADLDALDYEAALAGHHAGRDFPSRSGDDQYVLYTGGTTGLPKGVLWRHEDFFFACLQGGAGAGAPPARVPTDLAARLVTDPPTRVMLLGGPLHHAGGQWGAISSLLMGATVVVSTGRSFDAHAVWRTVARERVTNLAILGDAMARPLSEALAAGPASGGAYDTTSLVSIGTGGAIISPVVQRQLRDLLPDVMLSEVIGSSEGGLFAFQALGPADAELDARPRFALGPDAAVLDEALRPVKRGSGVIGRLARRGRVPIGYLNDPARTAATFPVIDGERWVVPGDLATLEPDGSIRLLGRGSTCINTGGEKVFPEEVEAALKAHPDVFDALVVGAADPRWGEQVVAVLQLRPAATVTDAALAEHCRAHLAGYKIPRRVCVVPEMLRHSNGKPDYGWASRVVEAAAATRDRGLAGAVAPPRTGPTVG